MYPCKMPKHEYLYVRFVSTIFDLNLLRNMQQSAFQACVTRSIMHIAKVHRIVA